MKYPNSSLPKFILSELSSINNNKKDNSDNKIFIERNIKNF